MNPRNTFSNPAQLLCRVTTRPVKKRQRGRPHRPFSRCSASPRALHSALLSAHGHVCSGRSRGSPGRSARPHAGLAKQPPPQSRELARAPRRLRRPCLELRRPQEGRPALSPATAEAGWAGRGAGNQAAVRGKVMQGEEPRRAPLPVRGGYLNVPERRHCGGRHKGHQHKQRRLAVVILKA